LKTFLHRLAATLILLPATLLCGAQQSKKRDTKGAWVFAYFKEPANQGIYLALSRDGLHYTPLNDGEPWLKPSEPEELMRDIYITRTPGGHGFRAVWTWGWHGNSMGTSESKDLMTWSPQRQIAIMGSFPDVQNTWAPETYWDAAQQQWLVLWSSSFKPAADGTPGEGLRLWSAHTKDFVTFTKPEKFFDRGFPVIDATLFQREQNGKHDVVMVLKDQTQQPLRYNERWTSGPNIEGPWGELSDTINEPWSEGPSVLQLGNRTVIFYDHYRAPNIRYEAIATTDWQHWTDITGEISLPEQCKHGSFFRVTEAEAKRLLARRDMAH
jgi:hypothetical protein